MKPITLQQVLVSLAIILVTLLVIFVIVDVAKSETKTNDRAGVVTTLKVKLPLQGSDYKTGGSYEDGTILQPAAKVVPASY